MAVSIALQIAIDAVRDLDQLGRRARQADAAGIEYVEVGTPLLTHFGAEAVRSAVRACSTSKVYADTKVVDFARLELTPVLDVGATSVTVLAVAKDHVIEEGLEVAASFRATLLASMMGCALRDAGPRARHLLNLGVPKVIAHGCGHDGEAAYADLLAYADELRGIPRTHVVIAGGLRAENIGMALARLPADHAIVGRGFNVGATLAEATSVFRQAIRV